MDNVALRQAIIAQFKPIISAWTEPDIYAISFFVYDHDDDPRKPTVTLGYNTERHFKAAVPQTYNEAEARWNYAFWPQSQEAVFGEGDTAGIVHQWVLDSHFPCTLDGESVNDGMPEGLDPFAANDYLQERMATMPPDALYVEFDERLQVITKAFVAVLIEVVKELHQSGLIREKFGKEIPVIIHELEYYDTIAEQNIEANGQALAQGLADYIYSMY